MWAKAAGINAFRKTWVKFINSRNSSRQNYLRTCQQTHHKHGFFPLASDDLKLNGEAGESHESFTSEDKCSKSFRLTAVIPLYFSESQKAIKN